MQRVPLTVASTAAPTVWWRCPSCHHPQFECSGRFRMNSNGKRTDIWLVYRCGACGATKNITVVERAPVQRIPRALFDAATANDPGVARALARDVALLGRAGTTVARGDVFCVEAPSVAPPATMVFAFAEPLLVRLDEVVAASLGSSRTAVSRMLRTGALELRPCTHRPDRLRLWSWAEVDVHARR